MSKRQIIIIPAIVALTATGSILAGSTGSSVEVDAPGVHVQVIPPSPSYSIYRLR